MGSGSHQKDFIEQNLNYKTAMSEVTEIQGNELDEQLTFPGPVVVDCTATWCGPCRAIAPSIDRLAAEYEDRAKVFKLDIDKNKATAKRFGIRSIPAVLVFKGGELVENMVGVAPYESFSQAVDKHL